jgi:outer membrane protein assembly factor BamB
MGMRIAGNDKGRRGPWLLACGAVVIGLLGCAADKPKPTPLEAYAPKLVGVQAWAASVGNVNFPLVPSVVKGVIYLVSGDGELQALNSESGAVQWRVRVNEPIAAGVGSDGRFVSVVTRDNEVVTFDEGKEVWRKRVASAVVTPPLVAGERVFVMGVDRAVNAFDAINGRRLWTFAKPGDALTLAQAGVVAAFRNTLLVGQGQRLTALDPLQGTTQWDVPLATPRGTNEVERLADLLGPVVRQGDRICARAFQSAVACADAARGSLLWSRNVGGLNAVGANAEMVFGADASDRISAWQASSGDVAWTSEKLLYRGLSGALADGKHVVFGDSEGFVHFLAAASGEQLLRLPTDGKAVVGTPVRAGSHIVVTTQAGGVFAFRAD